MSQLTLDDLVARIAQKTPTFPTSAQAALHVVDAINDPNCTIGSAARLVQLEPMLASKAVAMSNTVAYSRHGRTVTSVQDALQMIGLQTLKMLAVGVVMRQMSAGTAPAQRPIASQLWDHSMHVGALAFVIARRLSKQSPDAALFAGTVHELSGFYLLSLSADKLGAGATDVVRDLLRPVGPGERNPPEDAQQFDPLAARFGRPLLQAMRIPVPIIEAVQTTWHAYLALPPQTLGDTLMLADTLSSVRSPFEGTFFTGPPADRDLLDSFVGKEELDATLEESKETIEALIGALRS